MEIRASFWFVLFSVMLVLPSELVGQQPKISFEKYGVAEGLPEARVSSMIQDDQGFIWFATQNGLVKYDGYDFKTFEPRSKAEDSTQLNLKNLNGGIIKGKDGKLWIGGVIDGGLSSFDTRTERFRNFLHEPNNPNSLIPYRSAYPLLEDIWGNIWFANRSAKLRKWILCRWDTASEQAETFPYGITSRFTIFPSGSARFVEAKENGSIWVLDEDQNLRNWTPELDSFDIVHSAGRALPGWDRPDTISLIFAGLQSKLFLKGAKGIYVWDPVAKQVDQYYEHDPMDSNSPASGAINYVFEDHHGKYWLVHYNGSMTTIDPKRKLCTRHVYGEGKMAFPNGPATIWRPLIYISDEEELIFRDRASGSKHFLQYDFETKSFHLFDPHFNVPENRLQTHVTFFSMFKDKSNLLWLGYFGGLYKEAPNKQRISYYTHNENDSHSIPDDFIVHLFEDKTGRLWIATSKGLCQYIADQVHFDKIAFSPESVKDTTITQLYEDTKGQIWIGGLEGLFIFDEASNTARKVRFLSAEKPRVMELMEDNRKRLWVSVEGNGVHLLDIESKKLIKSFQPTQGDSSSLTSKNIFCLFNDSRGRMWLGDMLDNQFGLFCYDESQEKFIHYANGTQLKRSIGSNEILFIFEDDWQGIWVGTDNGIYYYKQEEDRFERFGDPIDISAVTAYEKADKETIWIATYSGRGLIKLNPRTHQYQIYGQSAGFLHGTSGQSKFDRKITLDQRGYLYYPTQRGLSVFDPQSKQVRNYGEEDGFKIKDFRYSSIATQSGDVWISSTKGLVRLSPESLTAQEATLPDVHITAMMIMDSTYSKPDGKLFKESVSYTERITLEHRQNDLSFEFVALHYLSPEDNQYAWKLENYDEDWSQPSLKRSARYTNLNPGTYTFRVKASNADGVWNEEGTSLQITIRPPWWATWWARTLLVLLISGILYFLYRFQVSRQLAQAENRRLKDLDAVKTSLYTNITHEFRTPLTVISGMATQIESPREAQHLIQRNSKHMLRLVNQMLDLAKLESGKLDLHLQQGDIISYLHYLTESFHSYAEAKDVELVFYAEDKEVIMDYDAEKIQHIISNLISNAVKFSPEGSKVILHVQHEQQETAEALIIKVVDQGIGIAPDKLPHVFDRFYQVDDSSTRKGEGTGIGLTFTRELVHLMGGKITAESLVGEGSTFRLLLPISREATPAEVLQQPAQADGLAAFTSTNLAEALPINPDLPQILIIEDNPDVIAYIKSCLQGTYQLLEAENGAIGIEKALELTPDLIISDVMMPEKDGFEVCKTLKQDERTSHIPIVLLTAKADVESRIAGLQEGADAYLAKPFEEKELLVRIEQLIQLRRSLMVRYRQLHGMPLLTEEKYKREDGFVRKVKLLVEERLSDDELNVDQIAREIGMSRSQLFRKLKALTGLSVSGFVREYRLERAKQLLKTTELSIAEVAYEVGFKNPNHFSTAFKAAFGTSPGATRK